VKGREIVPGMLREYSFFLPQKELEELRASGRLWDYAAAIRDLDKEFPTVQEYPKKGEVEFSYFKRITFG
jgi:hypothetical protein